MVTVTGAGGGGKGCGGGVQHGSGWRMRNGAYTAVEVWRGGISTSVFSVWFVEAGVGAGEDACGWMGIARRLEGAGE